MSKKQKVWITVISLNLINLYICLFESVSNPLLLFIWWWMCFFASIFAGMFLEDEE